jgi:polyamine oxidase
LATLYVAPAARSHGLGAQLVDHVMGEAARLGCDDVHLFTTGHERYYLDRGWRTVATADANGHDATVMVRRTSDTAARRSVSTRWCTDPEWGGGAYSYLRVGGTPAHRMRFLEPVRDRLWFAGEWTAFDYPGTAHGAWFAGERAGAAARAAGAQSLVIVGAGCAGIAAARTFGDGAVVVETTDRVGGRVRVDHTLGGPVHLGAAWMHGDEGHPFASLVEHRRASSWPEVATLSEFPFDEPALDAVWGDLESRIAAAAEEDEPDMSVAEFALPLLAPYDSPVLSMWLRTEFENLYAAPIHDVSLRNGTEPFRLPGTDAMVLDDLDGVINALAAALDVRTRTTVTAVDTAGVVTDDGRIDADAVIVTVPIGVLHRQAIGFDPPLPDDVVDALAHIGAGPVAKAFFTFDTPFWAPHPAFLAAGDPALPFEVWVDVSDLAGAPTLCAFATGVHAAHVEQMTEDDRCRLADHVLARIGLR